MLALRWQFLGPFCKTSLICCNFLFFALCCGVARGNGWTIAAPATQEDWRSFMSATDQWRKELWAKHTKDKKGLKDWSWTWKMGWIKTCVPINEDWCAAILQEGLGDRAALVRSKAAEALGLRYDGTANPAGIEALRVAFANPRNIHRGKPMFVANRILYAIHQIGGDLDASTGQALASQFPETQKYWQQLNQPFVAHSSKGQAEGALPMVSGEKSRSEN